MKKIHYVAKMISFSFFRIGTVFICIMIRIIFFFFWNKIQIIMRIHIFKKISTAIIDFIYKKIIVFIIIIFNIFIFSSIVYSSSFITFIIIVIIIIVESMLFFIYIEQFIVLFVKSFTLIRMTSKNI